MGFRPFFIHAQGLVTADWKGCLHRRFFISRFQRSAFVLPHFRKSIVWPERLIANGNLPELNVVKKL